MPNCFDIRTISMYLEFSVLFVVTLTYTYRPAKQIKNDCNLKHYEVMSLALSANILHYCSSSWGLVVNNEIT